MGVGVQSLVGEGCLVEQACWSPYQLSTAGDCFPRLEDIPEVAVLSTCPGSYRQNHSDALSEHVGGDQVQELGSIGPGDHSVVSNLEHFSDGSPYFGLQQCRVGSSLSPQRGASSPPAALHRMVSGPGDGHSSLQFWAVPIADLFTTRLNTKVEVFYSHLPDSLALPRNPLQVDWSQDLLYMSPLSPSCPLLYTR